MEATHYLQVVSAILDQSYGRCGVGRATPGSRFFFVPLGIRVALVAAKVLFLINNHNAPVNLVTLGLSVDAPLEWLQ